MNNPELLSAPLFNKRQEIPSARNGVDFTWLGAQLNLRAPSNPTEDEGDLQNISCLEVFCAQKVSEAGWKSPTVVI